MSLWRQLVEVVRAIPDFIAERLEAFARDLEEFTRRKDGTGRS